MTNKLDILAFGPHPDDIELGAGGVLAKASAEGKRIGMVDLSKGEMGTRGTVEIRAEEAQNAAEKLGAQSRLNLGLEDGGITADKASKHEVIKAIRYYQPDIVICSAPSDRHPDHGNAHQLVRESLFLSGLAKWETEWEGKAQKPWRVEQFYAYIQDDLLQPDVVIDISEYMDTKIESMLAHKSQFFDPNSSEPSTRIAHEHFVDQVKARAMVHGHMISVSYGEAYVTRRVVGAERLEDLI